MAAANPQNKESEETQRITDKWQDSTKDIWRRSTQVWSDSKDRYHQATLETWHRSSDSLANSKNRYEQSTTEAWRRSSMTLAQSKERCQQSTMDAWQRSTNSWKSSKARCRQSTAEMLSRSAMKLYQSTNQLQRLPHGQTKSSDNQIQTIQPSESTPALPSSLQHQTSQSSEPASRNSYPSQPPSYYSSTESPQSIQSSETTISSSSPQTAEAPSQSPTAPMPSKYNLIDPSSKDQKQDEQIRELFNMTDHTFFQLHQTKQLQKAKSELLGEIEYQWIDSAINDARRMSQDLAKLLEPHRLDMVKRKGKIGSSNKKRWKNEDCQKAYEKQSRLFRHQESLDKVFAHLQSLSSEQRHTPVSSPDTSPDSQEPHPVITPELDAVRPVAELTGDAIFAPTPAELASESKPETVIAELPGDTTVAPSESPRSVPKIIITRTPENISVEYLGSPATPDQPYHESHEMNEILGWKQTRNDVRLHQSASLSNIIAEMDNARIK